MTENFDQFVQNEKLKKQKSERLAKETKHEWSALKESVSRFASEGKEFDGHKFEWATSPTSRQFLRLNNVAAMFLDQGERNGVPQNCKVRFTRKPPGPREAYEGESPLQPLDWSLEPEFPDKNFVWRVAKLGETLSSAALVQKIAIELSKYHAAYEKAYGR